MKNTEEVEKYEVIVVEKYPHRYEELYGYLFKHGPKGSLFWVKCNVGEIQEITKISGEDFMAKTKEGCYFIKVIK